MGANLLNHSVLLAYGFNEEELVDDMVRKCPIVAGPEN